MNSRFYLALSAPFAPPSGKSVVRCIEDVLELLSDICDLVCSDGVDSTFRLAIGIASSLIEAFPLPTGEVNIYGQPFRDARNIMSCAEAQDFGASSHRVAIDDGTYALLGEDARAKYKQWQSARPQNLQETGGDIYCRNREIGPQ